MDERQESRLNAEVMMASQARSFCQHPFFSIYKKELEALITDHKNKWLTGTDEEARLERIRAQGIQKALDILKTYILKGDNASNLLNASREI